MCGIFGVIDHPSIDRDRFKNALTLLHHRGPDFTDAKFWERAAFGFTRLAILDLSPNGNQPMTLLDNSLTIVFNGAISLASASSIQAINHFLASSLDD